ncbi:RING/U-box protein [Trifolium pratense]|uniref:RING/U-box protein n=2 Tax=Trifolium pratense TaxID=57577 RepID=A0A2K3N6X7_TRIPR|nr:RING/U-box protein [Trifolium pratense]
MTSFEITEEVPSEQQRTRQNLTLETPKKTHEEAKEDFLRINIPLTPSPRKVIFSPCTSPGYFIPTNESPGPSPSSSKTRSTLKKTLIPKLSFKFKNTTSEIEKAAFLALGGSSAVPQKKPFLSRTLSRMKSRGRKTSSLPVSPVPRSTPVSVHGGKAFPTMASEKELQLPIHRSRSVPAFTEDTPVGGMFRIVRNIPQLNEKIATTASAASPTSENVETEDEGEDIPEEEAVCRICMVELGEGGDTFKLECSCKGELSLAHKECAVKWFSIKGNRTCDVCKQEVQNLPVTLLRLHQANLQSSRGHLDESSQYRQGKIIDVVSSMGSGAIAMSLPFSCILGLLASMTATTMVRRNHVWIYGTMQFVLVVLAGHLLYSLAHMEAVLAILLATFAGFGSVMCGTCILMDIMKWRRRWLAQLNQQNGGSEAVAPPDQSSAATHQTQIDPQQNELTA